jgi:hypothetical protein
MSNMANLPRNENKTYFDKSVNFVHSMLNGRDFPACIGLDIRVYNESGAQCKFAIDGVEFDVLDGTSRTISNVPFDKFEIISTGATANKITITVYGITLQQAKRYSNFNGVINDGIWGSY